MRVFLHIGLHKTATTYLQNQVFPHLSIAYLQAPPAVLDDIRWQQDYFFDPEAAREALVSQVPERGGALLISSEVLTGDPFLAYVNREPMLDRLRRMFPEAQILLGVRGQRGLLWSLYKHQLRFGGTRPLRDMLGRKDHWGPGWLDPETFLYTPFVDALAARFGTVPHLLVHEHLRADRDRYLGGLQSFLGAEFTQPISDGRLNEAAISDRQVRARRFLNQVAINRGRSQGVVPVPRPVQDGFVRVAGRLSRSVPDRAALDGLADRYRADNDALDERFDLRLREHAEVAAEWYLTEPS